MLSQISEAELIHGICPQCTGIPGFILGNTAEKVLHRVDYSVLMVKPEDFISPVTIDKE
ncbi:MAG: hypothetical protein ABFR35_10600 [Thermodesulfobacteriota bacterium]